ncbi:MAG: MBL fold metallo-hydrolase [Okeania sp. SIO2C2]|uniref:MBL fold metallo-hydrolase n=1 Tax=Okeania sp. SIO2C2 TaxID=2607787 RepID=UPI0013BC8C9A|nr:MBL fold metallo-hydrolase [Okeania sp. SIO2C2]NEP89048.1 MBL fold metallo-hydrolase [Okeania sp. SIO2C2]
MKRRKFIRYTQASLLALMGTGLTSKFHHSQAQTGESLTIKWLGHTCFLFEDTATKVLVNPFRPIGCTAGYRNPTVDTDLILISSRLLDEGVVENFTSNPPPMLLYEPGVYQVDNRQIQGIRTTKDREGGRRFGTNVAWLWQQAGIKILHLGGLASPIGIEERILIGRPDLLLIPVGGGPKAYTPLEAKQTLEVLKPRIVIPTHYKTEAADEATCDIVPIEEFLSVMEGTPVRVVNQDTISITRADVPQEGSIIEVLSYGFDQLSPDSLGSN